MLKFEYIEDKEFFEKLLLDSSSNSIQDFASLFDFRSALIKRKELYGARCVLNLDCCDKKSGFVVDHLIPISSNNLNKEIRNLIAEEGKKVKAQSFGSNHLDNLIIACNKCNNHKKHRFLSKEKMADILRLKKNIKR